MNQERIKIFNDRYFSIEDELENRINNFLQQVKEADGEILGIHLTCRPNNILVICIRYKGNVV